MLMLKAVFCFQVYSYTFAYEIQIHSVIMVATYMATRSTADFLFHKLGL